MLSNPKKFGNIIIDDIILTITGESMFCSFFKKIGLSVALLFSSFGSMFHKEKAVKPISTLTQDQLSNSEFIIKEDTKIKETLVIEPIIIEPTIKEKISLKELELKKLIKEKKVLKKKRKEAEYQQWKKEQRDVMNEIDIRIARSPKEMEVLETWTLTEKEMDALIKKPNRLNMKSIDEPNDIFI